MMKRRITSKKHEYAIHTADGFLAGYIEAESPSRAIGEALTAWPDLSRRESSHPLSASPVVVAGASGNSSHSKAKRHAGKTKLPGGKYWKFSGKNWKTSSDSEWTLVTIPSYSPVFGNEVGERIIEGGPSLVYLSTKRGQSPVYYAEWHF